MSMPLASYCNTEFPLKTDMKMGSSSRSKSPYRGRNNNSSNSNLMKHSEIAFQERRRSFAEDPGLLETSAIEVVLESAPITPRKKPSGSFTVNKKKQEPRTPDLTPASSSSDHTPPEKREDLKRKSFKQKFMQKKKVPESPKGIADKTTSSNSTKGSSRGSGPVDLDDDYRNPIETSRRCFPFSVHQSMSEKTRGRSLSRGRTSKSSESPSDEKVRNNRANTPLRRKARSLSRRRGASVAPTPKTTATSKASPLPFTKKRTSNSKTPLMEPHMRSSNEDVAEPGQENPDPHIEERLCMRPRLLSRLESHGAPPVAPPSPLVRSETTKTPHQITLARQKSMFSEISTPSAVSTQFPVVQHPVVQQMEESIAEATKNGKKIDRMLVYETLFKIAGTLESPEEQAAMQRELQLLMQNQEAPPTAAVAPQAPVPQDTFSPQLSENLGPAFTPPRTRVSSRISRASAGKSQNRQLEETSDDGFTEWADELDSQSSASTSHASIDTINFLTEMFNFQSFFSSQDAGDRDMRDDEDEGEITPSEDDEEQVPESWNNFKPPPNVLNSNRRMARRRSRQERRGSKKTAPPPLPTTTLSDTESDFSKVQRVSKPSKETSPDRRSWWRKKDNEPLEQQYGHRERSMLKEEDNLSLSSIDSQQYKPPSPGRRLIHPPRMRGNPNEDSPSRRNFRPSRFRGDDLNAPIPNQRRRSKSVDGRRTMLM